MEGIKIINTIVWKRPGLPLNRQDIKKVEEIFGVCLPEDYVNCIQLYHGAKARPNGVVLNGNVRVFANLLSFADDSVDNIVKTYNYHKDRFKDGIFPFACDPAGNYFCFDYREDKNNPSIMFWNHEFAVSESDYSEDGLKSINIADVQERAMEKVCSNFTELLNMLQ